MTKVFDAPSLKVHEWMAVIMILGLLGCLTAISWFNQKYPAALEVGDPHFIAAQEIEISVQGAVEHSGRLVVKKGATVREALAQAGLQPDADLRRLKLEAKVRRNQIIKVPKQALVTVIIEGAVVNPGAIVMPKSARLLDLLEKVAFQDNADKDKLRKKRRLKDGEVIVVPAKKG